MALHALRESFLDARPLERQRGRAFASSLSVPSKAEHPSAHPSQSQLFIVALGAGFLSLALLATIMLQAPFQAGTALPFLLVVAISLVAAAGQCQRIFIQAKAAELSLAAQNALIEKCWKHPLALGAFHRGAGVGWKRGALVSTSSRTAAIQFPRFAVLSPPGRRSL